MFKWHNCGHAPANGGHEHPATVELANFFYVRDAPSLETVPMLEAEIEVVGMPHAMIRVQTTFGTMGIMARVTFSSPHTTRICWESSKVS